MSDGALFVPGRFLPAAEMRARLLGDLGGALVPADAAPGRGPARYWRHDPSGGLVGFIAALTENFCETCNRVRLTARGDLHACLARDECVPLRDLIRSGATDEALGAAIASAVLVKKQGHDFSPLGCGAPRKHMVAIGG
jgi:cyclic pyranopterin phosphate synthase